MGAHLLHASKQVLGGLFSPLSIIGQAVLARQIDLGAVKGALQEAFGVDSGSMITRWDNFINNIQHECKSSKNTTTKEAVVMIIIE